MRPAANSAAAVPKSAPLTANIQISIAPVSTSTHVTASIAARTPSQASMIRRRG